MDEDRGADVHHLHGTGVGVEQVGDHGRAAEGVVDEHDSDDPTVVAQATPSSGTTNR